MILPALFFVLGLSTVFLLLGSPDWAEAMQGVDVDAEWFRQDSLAYYLADAQRFDEALPLARAVLAKTVKQHGEHRAVHTAGNAADKAAIRPRARMAMPEWRFTIFMKTPPEASKYD